ncbi:MAG: response regulator [Opitutales bacterium]|nr:response regulator [Opitutales bacterium]
MRILLVEDDSTLCDLLSRMLKFEGIDSVIANDGLAAEKYLLSNPQVPIDLILCDVMMPNMDGYEFLKRVKNIPAYRDVAFVFTTARVSRDEELRGLMLGARAYLKKPVEIATLLEVIDGLNEKK